MQARALNTLGWLYLELGSVERALDCNRRSLALAAALPAPDPEIQSNARLNLADCLMTVGRLAEAETFLREVEHIVRHPRPEDRWMLWRYAQHLFHSSGELALLRGELDHAARYAEECLRLALETGSRKNVVKARRLRAEVALARGETMAAREEIESTLPEARALGNPVQLWKTLTTLGRILDAEGATADARATLAAARSVIEDTATALRDTDLVCRTT
jgi:tetratricopeptide (TPR) repeat protein